MVHGECRKPSVGGDSLAIVTPLPLAFDGTTPIELVFNPARGINTLILTAHLNEAIVDPSIPVGYYSSDNIVAMGSDTSLSNDPNNALFGARLVRKEWVAGELRLQLDQTGSADMDIVGGYAILDDGSRVDFGEFVYPF